jgi:hypothetical protein
MALLGPREMSDLSPLSGPKLTLMIQIVDRDFMSTRLAAHQPQARGRARSRLLLLQLPEFAQRGVELSCLPSWQAPRLPSTLQFAQDRDDVHLR